MVACIKPLPALELPMMVPSSPCVPADTHKTMFIASDIPFPS